MQTAPGGAQGGALFRIRCALRSGPDSPWISNLIGRAFSDRSRSSSEEGNVPGDLIVQCQMEVACRGDAQAALERFAHNRLAGRGRFARVSPSFGVAPGGVCARQARRRR